MKTSMYAPTTRMSPMGLSIMSSLQRTGFVTSYSKTYYMRKIANRVVFYPQSVKRPTRQRNYEKSLMNLQSPHFTGKLSWAVKKRMVQTIQNWQDTVDEMNATKANKSRRNQTEIVMLTLTLSKKQHHDDRYIKRYMLVPFIRKLNLLAPNLNYLWKAEAQSNGNVHFHILIDDYISKEDVQRAWNTTQHLHGYHDELSNYSNGLGQPSTRIEALRDKNNGVAYAAKYVSKEEGKRLIKGRLWGCNDRLRELRNVEFRLTKDEMIDVCMLQCRQIDALQVSEYAAIVNHPINYKLVRDSLRNNYSADVSLRYNVALMTSYECDFRFAMMASDWYLDLVKEVGDLHSNYLLKNDLLFDDIF